jgi:hypothetical protein
MQKMELIQPEEEGNSFTSSSVDRPGGLILSEISYSQKDIYCMIRRRSLESSSS